MCNFTVFGKTRLNILQPSQARRLLQEIDNEKISNIFKNIFNAVLLKVPGRGLTPKLIFCTINEYGTAFIINFKFKN